MRIHTLMQLGFKKVSEEDFEDAMRYLRNYAYPPFTKSKYDSSLDEPFKVWALCKDDFTEMFGSMPDAIITTIIGTHYKGHYYLRHWLIGLRGSKGIAA